ncbi:hypothetical protein SELMODRAFT_430685 [Selaginella moellendorffii]|uniref:Uncharacterized protein n=1 Tax=Selaginella moellendorffii TaxID=88036 RepID=D8TA62_SELML|nr:hypothetical protein SELMODRAFT_430685 [Selaginella moellendorffii]
MEGSGIHAVVILAVLLLFPTAGPSSVPASLSRNARVLGKCSAISVGLPGRIKKEGRTPPTDASVRHLTIFCGFPWILPLNIYDFDIVEDIKQVEIKESESNYWEYSPEEKVATINTIQCSLDWEWVPPFDCDEQPRRWYDSDLALTNVVTERIRPKELLLVLPPSPEARGISRAAQQNYDVVGTAEELSELDPAVEDSTVLVCENVCPKALTVLQNRREGFRSSTRAAGSANSIIDMNCIITEIKSRIESEPKLPMVRKFVQASHDRGEDPVKLWTRSGSESVSWWISVINRKMGLFFAEDALRDVCRV